MGIEVSLLKPSTCTCLVSEIARKSVYVCVHPENIKSCSHKCIQGLYINIKTECFNYNKWMYAPYKKLFHGKIFRLNNIVELLKVLLCYVLRH